MPLLRTKRSCRSCLVSFLPPSTAATTAGACLSIHLPLCPPACRELCFCAASPTHFTSSLCTAEDRWQPGQPRYDSAAVEVAKKVCRETAREIQDRVFKLKLLKQDKADESGKPATKLGRDINKQRG
jgi:hypothetical protein